MGLIIDGEAMGNSLFSGQQHWLHVLDRPSMEMGRIGQGWC